MLDIDEASMLEPFGSQEIRATSVVFRLAADPASVNLKVPDILMPCENSVSRFVMVKRLGTLTETCSVVAPFPSLTVRGTML